jgi:hypothetical protein
VCIRRVLQKIEVLKVQRLTHFAVKALQIFVAQCVGEPPSIKYSEFEASGGVTW